MRNLHSRRDQIESNSSDFSGGSVMSQSVYNQMRKKYIIQAAGHRDSIQLDNNSGSKILKLYDDNEHKMIKILNRDKYFKSHVPRFFGTKIDDLQQEHIIMENLTHKFININIMDAKLGFLTFDDEDKSVTVKQRSDLYQKMVKSKTLNLLTAEERERKWITKARYLGFRDQETTTTEYGYRFEGISNGDEKTKTSGACKNPDQAGQLLRKFLKNADRAIIDQFVSELKTIKANISSSPLFPNLKIIGLSLLFIYETAPIPEHGSSAGSKLPSVPDKESLSQKDSGLPQTPKTRELEVEETKQTGITEAINKSNEKGGYTLMKVSSDGGSEELLNSARKLSSVASDQSGSVSDGPVVDSLDSSFQDINLQVQHGSLQPVNEEPVTVAGKNWSSGSGSIHQKHRRTSNNFKRRCKLGMIDFAKVKFNDPDSESYVPGLYEAYQENWLKSFDNLLMVFESYVEELDKKAEQTGHEATLSDDCAFESIKE